MLCYLPLVVSKLCDIFYLCVALCVVTWYCLEEEEDDNGDYDTTAAHRNNKGGQPAEEMLIGGVREEKIDTMHKISCS